MWSLSEYSCVRCGSLNKCIEGILVEVPEGTRPFWRPWLIWENLIERSLEEMGWGLGLDASGSGQGEVAAALNTAMKFQFSQTKGISWLPENLSDSEEWLCFMEFVGLLVVTNVWIKVKKERVTNRENNLRRFPLEALLLFAVSDKVDLLGAVKCAKP